MKRNLALVFLLGFSTPLYPNNLLTTLASAGKNSVQYLCSKDGIKDICAAYCLGMGLTTMHELGHALMGKLFYNEPIDITIGTSSEQQPVLAKIGGLKLAGFDPSIGFSIVPMHKDRTKDSIISLAGPAFAIVSSIVAYMLLKKYASKFYLTKAVSLFSLFNHTLGPAGLAGIFYPGSDAYRVKQLLTRKPIKS